MRTRKWCAVNDRETKGRFLKQEKKSNTGSKHYECGSFRGQSGLVLNSFPEINLV